MTTGSTKAAKAKREKGSLTSADWINAAIDVLVASGVADLKVERLAASLGVSKGSFYWHFQNRDDLLDQVLEQWSRVACYDQTKRIDGEEPDPARRLLRFMLLPLSSERATRMADLELAIMGWARRDPRAQAALEAVDRTRTANAHALLREIGVSDAKAQARAHEAYASIRYVSLRRDLPVDERRELIGRAHGRLVQAD
jgi:AcrR family transcriptional regulator